MRVYLRKGPHYLTVNPTGIGGQTNDMAFPVAATTSKPGPFGLVEMTKHDDGRYDARFVASRRQLTVDPAGFMDTRQAGHVGSWELLSVVKDGDLLLAYRTAWHHAVNLILTVDPVE